MVDGFGDHIVDFSLISGGSEMEAAHAQDRTLQAGLAQRTLWRLEVAEGRLVFSFDSSNCSGHLVTWNHGGNSCEYGAFQEASAAYLKVGFGIVLHDYGFL